jgi:branched-chain amino acid aminotransferase
MEIEGINSRVLINGEIVHKTFPYKLVYEGDLIYEVVRIVDGYPLFWKEHLDRMINSLELINQPGEAIVKTIEKAIRTYIETSDIANNNVKIIVGNFTEDAFDYMVYYIPSYYPEASFYDMGAQVVTLSHVRKNPNAKVVNHHLTDLVASIRKETGAYEVALVNSEGVITEGSRSNLFFLKDGCVHVSQGQKILKGITMLKTIELLKKLGLSYKEDDVDVNKLTSFDACFMTSTSNNVLPIDTIDGYKFDSSHHNTIKTLMNAFNGVIKEDQQIYKSNYK